MGSSRIIASFGNETWDIVGDEMEMADQFARFKEALDAPDGTRSSQFFEFIGMQNQADRSPETMLLKLEDVKAIALQELR